MNLPALPAGDDGQPAEDTDTSAKPPVSRRTLDEIFGDVLPVVTRDELEDRAEDGGRDADRERWYRDNRPPHHG